MELLDKVKSVVDNLGEYFDEEDIAHDLNGEIVENEIWAQRRWVTVHRFVIKVDDQYVALFSEVGSTEMQDGSGVVDYHIVVPQEVKVIKYVKP